MSPNPNNCHPTNQETPEHNPPCRYGELDGFQGAISPCTCPLEPTREKHPTYPHDHDGKVLPPCFPTVTHTQEIPSGNEPCCGASDVDYCYCTPTATPEEEKPTYFGDIKHGEDECGGACHDGYMCKCKCHTPTPEQKDFVEGEEEKIKEHLLANFCDGASWNDARADRFTHEGALDIAKYFYAQGEQAERERIWREAKEKTRDVRGVYSHKSLMAVVIDDLKAIIHSTDKP